MHTLKAVVAALVLGIGAGSASADCVGLTFEPTSGKFTGTYSTAGVTATKEGGQGCDVDTLKCVRLFFDDELVVEKCVETLGPTITANVTFDSTHFAHGHSVQLKAQYQYKKLSDGTLAWSTIINGPSIPVYNRLEVFHDGSVFAAGSTYFYATKVAWHYEGALTDTSNWTRNNNLDSLVDRTAHYVMTHGGTYGSGDGYLIPPGGGGNIDANVVPPKIQESVTNGNLILAFALLMACDAGGNDVLPEAYMTGGSPTPNRFVLVPRIALGAVQVSSFIIKFCDKSEAGLAARMAAEEASSLVLWPSSMDFEDRWNFYGDPAAKVKYVYDGNASATVTAWKR